MNNKMILKAGASAFNFFRKNLPTILTWTTAGGVVATAVSSASASKKAERDKLRYAINNSIYTDELSKAEIVQVTWKEYVKPAAIASATIFCAFKSNAINLDRQRALAGSYILLRENFDNYIRKVKEHYGEDADKEIKKELAIEKAKTMCFQGETLCSTNTTSVDLDDDVRRIFYDVYSGRLFESTMAKVLEAEYHLNRNMNLNVFVTLQDWYKYLGIDPFEDDCPPWVVGVNSFEALGWQICDSYTWIDFDYEKYQMDIPTEDGNQPVEAIFISFGIEPEPESYFDY